MVEAQHSRRVDRSEEQGPRVVIVGAGFVGAHQACVANDICGKNGNQSSFQGISPST